MTETMADLIAELSDQEKECLRILSAGKRGTALTKELLDKGISQETFKTLVNEKVNTEQLLLLMEMADEWL